MASIKEIIRQERDTIECGIAWLVVWKEGRSWKIDYFYQEDGSYDDGLLFSEEDYSRLKEIVELDHNAIFFNGYYMGFGDGDGTTLQETIDRVLWFYSEGLNLLSNSFDGLVQMIEKDYGENGTEENLKAILESIKDKVIVTGSYAYGTQTANSDIDLYVKEIPEELVDCEADYVEDTYVKTLIRFFEKLGYQWSSCMIESFAVDDTYIPLEFSSLYNIEDEIFEIEILGVKMLAAKSNHTSEKYLNGQKRNRILKE